MAGYRTRLIVDPSDVPEGFVQIARMARNRTEAVWLSRAHTSGDIAAVKLARFASDRTGKVYVDSKQAFEYLESRRRKTNLNGLKETGPSWTINHDDVPQASQPTDLSIYDLTLAVRDLQAAVELLTERLSNASVMLPA